MELESNNSFSLRRHVSDDDDLTTFDLSVDVVGAGRFCAACRASAGGNAVSNGGLNNNNHQSRKPCTTAGCPGSSRLPMTHVRLHDDEADDIPLLLTSAASASDHHEDGDHGMEHCHSIGASAALRRQATVEKAKRKLMAAIGLCLVFIVGEVAGGYFSGSLAIMTDAAHMFSDFASFCVGLGAIYLGNRPAAKKFNFGYLRAEALGALFTVIIIWYVTGVLLYLAVHRIKSLEFDVEPNPMMIVAACAVLFNIVLGVLLHGVPHGHSHGGGGHGHSHRGHSHLGKEDDHAHSHAAEHINIRAAFIHVVGDLIQSIGVLISSIIIKVNPDLKIADPICTLVFSVIVFFTTLSVLRDSVRILMEGVPASVSYDAVHSDLSALPDVVRVHDLRVWALTTDKLAASVHLAVNAAAGSQRVLHEATRLMRVRHGVQITTVQVEDYNAHAMSGCPQCQAAL